MAPLGLKWLPLVVVLILALEATPDLSSGVPTAAIPASSSTGKPIKPTASTTTAAVTTITNNNSTTGDGPYKGPSNNKGLLKRMLYVAVGLSALVAIYFIFKTITTKRKKSKSKKYGVLHSSGDMEMQPLDKEDEDEDDMTVFDLKDRKTRK